MKVLVTGGAGFIGSHVTEQLLSDGHEVAVVDDLSSGRRENVPKEAVFFELDIRSGCPEVFSQFEPEVVTHQAAQIDVRRSLREPAYDAGINVVGTIRLLESCVRHGVRKFVFASSGGAIYGEQREFPASEEHVEYPVSPYGVSKLAGERYLHFYRSHYRIGYTALRYANVYGPRQDPHGEAGVVAIFCKNLASGQTSTINGTGDQTRDYVHVRDIARANVMSLETEHPSGAYNIGTGVETSVNRLYAIMQETSGRALPPRHGASKPGEQVRSSVDATKAKRLLGWVPRVGLAEGLRETLQSFGAL